MTSIQLLACLGMIVGGFLLLGIRPIEFTDGLFGFLAKEPENIRNEIHTVTKRKKARFLRKAVAAVFCVAAVIAAVLFLKERFLDENYRAGGLGQAVNGFLKEGKEMYKAKEAYQSIDKTDENADTLKDLLDKNPETWEFVKNYSKMKDRHRLQLWKQKMVIPVCFRRLSNGMKDGDILFMEII